MENTSPHEKDRSDVSPIPYYPTLPVALSLRKFAEFTSRTVQAVLVPRSHLDFACSRAELTNVGVYFLIGESVAGDVPLIYVGEAEDCATRLPQWQESTIKRMESSVYQILAQAGYIKDTRTLLLQRARITAEVIGYLERNHEDYVLRCITVGT